MRQIYYPERPVDRLDHYQNATKDIAGIANVITALEQFRSDIMIANHHWNPRVA
jgi:hypothetical protein